MTWIPSRLGESWFLTLSPALSLTVTREVQSRNNPSPTPYSASIFGARLARRFATDTEAKAAAVKMAKQHLTTAMTAIDAVTTE